MVAGLMLMRGLALPREATWFAVLALILSLPGCSAGITTHDGARAAELVVDFLSSLRSEHGVQMAYDWTDDGYKAEVPAGEFTRIISDLRAKNSRADIRLLGYETFGSKEMIVVYAYSETIEGELFFKFSLAGSKHKDYYLRYLEFSDTDYGKSGIYRDFSESVVVKGV